MDENLKDNDDVDEDEEQLGPIIPVKCKWIDDASDDDDSDVEGDNKTANDALTERPSQISGVPPASEIFASFSGSEFLKSNEKECEIPTLKRTVEQVHPKPAPAKAVSRTENLHKTETETSSEAQKALAKKSPALAGSKKDNDAKVCVHCARQNEILISNPCS